ncbi:MAG: M23 family metallopeptidase [Erysipelotrichaceae bacterium]|nr:M23 family metallopeptidase [Erysipelotrichaceae bacterium]
MTNKVKIIIAIAISAVLTCADVFLFSRETVAMEQIGISDAIVKQKVDSVSLEPVTINKLYYQDKLIGILADPTGLDRVVEKGYQDYYAENFPGVTVILNNEVFLVEEKSFVTYENRDEDILNYIYDNDLFAIKACKVTIGNGEVIYVRSKAEFQEALDEYVLNFISSDSLYKLKNSIKIDGLKTYGEVDTNIYIEETITATETMASATQMLKNKEEIFMYLCYGRDYSLKYYTVEQYDTIPGVAAKTGLTAEQVVAINRNLVSVDQALATGEKLNITYFSSPITVVVEKQRMDREVIYQPKTEFITDDSIPRQAYIVEIEGNDGQQNAWYTDIYVNGVMKSYRLDNVVVTVPAKARVIRVGAEASQIDTAGQRFRLPVDYPAITCKFWCYYRHMGVDFIDYHNRYGIIYACADGVITKNTYADDRGFYYFIQHGEYVFEYCHMYERGWFPVGTQVYQSQPIGRIGNTGNSTGAHVHIAIWTGNTRDDPCLVLPCKDAKNGARLGYY